VEKEWNTVAGEKDPVLRAEKETEFQKKFPGAKELLAFRAEAAQRARTVEGTPFAEEMPLIANHISRSIFEGYFAGKGGKRIELFDGKGKITPQGRVALREQIVADLTATGMKVSTDNTKSVDSIIDLAFTAKPHGVIDKPNGISREQFNRLVGELYFSNNPNIRIGSTELTHVPMVVEGTLNHLKRPCGFRANQRRGPGGDVFAAPP
jgi:hypothetical protein